MAIYYGNAGRRKAMDRLYGRFCRPGDLVFDVGAHVGDRVASFRRLGARVVAVEPQPGVRTALTLLYGRDPNIVLEPCAVGASAGSTTFWINVDNPTVSTASQAFVEAASRAETGWDGQVWRRRVEVPLDTLDGLIARHGTPRFAKIDVEGFEADVLAGLSTPLDALSFEFTTIQPEVAFRCIACLANLGPYRFNVALGESQKLSFDRWCSRNELEDWLSRLPAEANSGDVYALLDHPKVRPVDPPEREQQGEA
ncbi:FkbM family methyltransferase [Amorphus orientalis]|uniref:FkbM family methyltransferase n=1 Tax=Amorphus orientalis TaxID=649198 RepID=A0AAE4AUN4_9HYPH|nr:FkbM family methyltransferase [Amorphus orientalis]MDQ0315989.1 FkbM family methyltransferase [Amorphus orientalis]